jgi:hypothetical protein
MKPCWMSAVGQTRRFRNVRLTSGLPLTADVFRPDRQFALGQSRHFAVEEDSEPFRAGPHEGLHRHAD